MNSRVKISLDGLEVFQKDYSLTKYRVVYEISNRIRFIFIEAATPMLAFKKFKEMMPALIYKNLAVHDVEIELPKQKLIQKKVENTCFVCRYFTNKKTA